jgi:DNA-binding IclR family transcriptional regulator
VTGVGTHRVKSADRALAILEIVSETPTAPTFNELEARLQYPRASLHGLLVTLQQRGWLERDPSTRRYGLGARAAAFGRSQCRLEGVTPTAREQTARR